jgi:hypothetical protein
MNPFARELQHLDARLDLPQPARSRVLLEIAADLEDLYQLLMSEGRGEAESRRRAVEMLDLSDAALHDLARVHASPLRRLLDRLGERGRGRVERGALVVILGLILVGGGRPLLSLDVFARASQGTWIVAALTVVALGIALSKLYLLQIRQDHRPRRLRRGLALLPGLALACVATGFGVQWVELWLAARRVAPAPGDYLPHLVDWALRGSATLIVSFHAAILCALLWFVIERRIARIERHEAALLLEG